MRRARTVAPGVARGVLEQCLGLRAGERLVVVADVPSEAIGRALFQGGLDAGADACMALIPPSGRHGAEPPDAAARAMEGADVVVCPTRFSLSHTQARLAATRAGARVATMPGIHEGMFFDGPITADVALVERRTLHLQRLLTDAGEACIVSGEGSELRLSLRGREGRASTGRFLTPGAFGNLPTGEAYLAPVEGSAVGELVVNASVAGIGRLRSPLRLRFADGLLVAAEGEEAAALLGLLGDAPAARNVAELGIGTNEKARITGVILEDEKAIGTLHVACGDSSTFGGTVRAGVHIDTVIDGPDLYLDGVHVVGGGRLMFEEGTGG